MACVEFARDRLVSGKNHGIDGVDGNDDKHPANRGEQKAAGDLSDRMSREEIVRGGTLVSELR